MKKSGFLEGADGGKSSKRLCGCFFCGIGIMMMILLFIFGLTHPDAVCKLSFDVSCTLITSGACLLGFGTLFENIKSKDTK